VSRDPQVAILGSGANGSAIGADLITAGVDVTLIEQWPEHVEAMRRDGLTIRMPDDELHVRPRVLHLCEVATLREQFDVVLIVMKAYDTRWAAQLIEPCLAIDGLAAAVQNGMSTEALADVVGPARAVGSVIEISSMMTSPGVVDRHSPPSRSWFALGTLDDAVASRAAEVAELLVSSGPVELVSDIRATKWMKLVSNCTTLVPTAILGLPMLSAVDVPGMREVMLGAGREALVVGLAQGFPVVPIFGLTAEDVSDTDHLVEHLLDTLFAGFVLPHTTTTVLHDWQKGRHSEVDDINGEVVRRADALGLGVPFNRAVVEVACRIERGELLPHPENVGLIRSLVEAPVTVSSRFRPRESADVPPQVARGSG
jgi:2-dehydropantoate 2-reductase